MSKKKAVSTKTFEEFLRLTARLDPVEFLGLCRILCVEVNTDEKDEKDQLIAREFPDILSDVMDKFLVIGRKQRREILKVLQDVEKEKNKEAKAKGNKFDPYAVYAKPEVNSNASDNRKA